MKLSNLILVVVAVMLVLSCTSQAPKPTSAPTPPPAPAPTPAPVPTPPPAPTPKPIINGSLENVKGVPVLRLWGSHYEMGYAYGYLCASQIMAPIKSTLSFFSHETANTYEGMVSRMKRYVLWSDDYLEEARACLAGIETALGSLPVIEHNCIKTGPKKVDLEMLLFTNSILNIMKVDQGCSGFAAWGKATGDGQTRAGGNVDSPARRGASSFLLIVRKPDYGLSTVRLGTYGQFLWSSVGPLKAMNETGLVVTTQGAYGVYPPAWAKVAEAGYTHVMLRDIMEQIVAGPNMVTNLTEMFQKSKTIFSGTLLFAQKRFTEENPQADKMALVIEKDPFGFTARLPSHNRLYKTPQQEAIFATNHFLRRQIPAGYGPGEDSVNRYKKMAAVLAKEVVSGLSDMQKVLKAASVPGSIHSIYMEPDSLTIHIAYGTEKGHPSPSLTPVTFTWNELFAPIPK